jgi:signal peptidase
MAAHAMPAPLAVPRASRRARRKSRLTLSGSVYAASLVLFAVVAAAALLGRVEVSPVLSGSMVPSFSAGDAVLTRPVPAADLAVGQVAVIARPGDPAPTAHRVVSVSGPADARVVVTRGDANRSDDPPLALSSPTVRVVVGTVPRLGGALMLLATPVARAALVGVVGLILTFLATRGVLRRVTPIGGRST